MSPANRRSRPQALPKGKVAFDFGDFVPSIASSRRDQHPFRLNGLILSDVPIEILLMGDVTQLVIENESQSIRRHRGLWALIARSLGRMLWESNGSDNRRYRQARLAATRSGALSRAAESAPLRVAANLGYSTVPLFCRGVYSSAAYNGSLAERSAPLA